MKKKPEIITNSFENLNEFRNSVREKEGLRPLIPPKDFENLNADLIKQVNSFNSVHHKCLKVLFKNDRKTVDRIVLDHKTGYSIRVNTKLDPPQLTVKIRAEYYVTVLEFLIIIENKILKTKKS